MRRLNHPLLLAWVAGVLVAAGCSGRSDRPPLAKVRGTVTYQGKPLAAGTLVFEVPGKRQAQGKIVDGKIAEAGTYALDDGVPLGTARIAVFATEPAPPKPSASGPGMDLGKSLIPSKYNDPSTSGLMWKIEAGQNNLSLNLQ